MNKDFNKFIDLMNSKDWDLVPDKISSNIKSINLNNPSNIAFLISEITKANLQATLTILKDYHDWLNSND